MFCIINCASLCSSHFHSKKSEGSISGVVELTCTNMLLCYYFLCFIILKGYFLSWLLLADFVFKIRTVVDNLSCRGSQRDIHVFLGLPIYLL